MTPTRERRHDERGFTLIELLVVVIVIGIIVMIAVPAFTHQKAKAADATVVAQTQSIAKHVETLLTEGAGTPDGNSDAGLIRLVEDGETVQVPTSQDVRWAVRGSSSIYCVSAWSTKPAKYTGTAPLHYDSSTGKVGTAPCAAAGSPAAGFGAGSLPSMLRICQLPFSRAMAPQSINSPTKFGWAAYTDKTSATTLAELEGCDVVYLPGEAWHPDEEPAALARQFYDQGGRVLSTGNDTRPDRLPHLIAAGIEVQTLAPQTGGVPVPLAERQRLTPTFPAWTPGSGGWQDDRRAITALAPGAVCVAHVTAAGNDCKVIAQTNVASGRWVHIHARIGGKDGTPGEEPVGDAALRWLTAP